MYDYDRRRAAPPPRDYAEALDRNLRQYGSLMGSQHTRKVPEARRLTRELDRLIKDYLALNPDDAWAGSHRKDKIMTTWRDLQKVYQFLFGFDPPTVDAWL